MQIVFCIVYIEQVDIINQIVYNIVEKYKERDVCGHSRTSSCFVYKNSRESAWIFPKN